MSIQVAAIRRFLSRLLLPVTACVLGSCAELEQQVKEQAAYIKKIQEDMIAAQTLNSAIAYQMNMLRSDHDELSRLVGCSNTQIRDFMRSCVSRHNFVCSVQNIDQALRVMTNINHVIAYVWPDSPALVLERIGQIKEVLRRHTRLSTSRLLVVAAPAGTSSIDTSRAEQIARSLRNQIVTDIYPATHPEKPTLPTLPPLLLGCNERDELLRRYRQMLPNRDTEVIGEPKSNQRRIVLWFFIVDC